MRFFHAITLAVTVWITSISWATAQATPADDASTKPTAATASPSDASVAPEPEERPEADAPYRWYRSHWWYRMPEGYWMVHDRGQWHRAGFRTDDGGQRFQTPLRATSGSFNQSRYVGECQWYRRQTRSSGNGPRIDWRIGSIGGMPARRFGSGMGIMIR